MTLSEADVAAMFAGRPSRTPPDRAAGPATATRGPRYDQCSGCKRRQPCLSSFMGDHDWEPDIPADSPLRAQVRRLRRESGRRTILLCGGCIDRLSEVVQPVVAGEVPARLFEP